MQTSANTLLVQLRPYSKIIMTLTVALMFWSIEPFLSEVM